MDDLAPRDNKEKTGQYSREGSGDKKNFQLIVLKKIAQNKTQDNQKRNNQR